MWLRTKRAGSFHLDSSGLYVDVVAKTRAVGALGGGWNQFEGRQADNISLSANEGPAFSCLFISRRGGAPTHAYLAALRTADGGFCAVCGLSLAIAAPTFGRGRRRRRPQKGSEGVVYPSGTISALPAIRSTSGPCHRRRLRLCSHTTVLWALHLCRGLPQTRRHRPTPRR